MQVEYTIKRADEWYTGSYFVNDPLSLWITLDLDEAIRLANEHNAEVYQFIPSTLTENAQWVPINGEAPYDTFVLNCWQPGVKQ